MIVVLYEIMLSFTRFQWIVLSGSGVLCCWLLVIRAVLFVFDLSYEYLKYIGFYEGMMVFIFHSNEFYSDHIKQNHPQVGGGKIAMKKI